MEVYNSIADLRVRLLDFDATSEAYEVFSEDAVVFLLNNSANPYVQGVGASGINNYLVIFSATGNLAGVRYVGLLGTKFVLEAGAPLAVSVLGTPVEVRVWDDIKTLENYFKTIDPTATVISYPDPSTVDTTGTVFRIISGASSLFTVVRCATSNIPSVIFIRDIGAKFLTVTKV